MQKDNYFINFIIIILFFANIINYYLISTTFLVEFISISLFSYGYFIQGNKFTKAIYLQLFFLFFLIFVLILSILQSNGTIGSLGKETYRSFSILFFFIPLFLIDLSYEKTFKCILLLCKLCLIYTIYELVYINIISPGNIGGLIFGDAILDFYSNNDVSPYLLPQGGYVIPFIRPFGVFLQPQKSTFIFSFAIIVLYILKNDFSTQKTSDKWYYLFLIGSILAGGKTALLCNLLLFTIIKLQFFKRIVSYKQIVLLLVIILSFFPFIFFCLHYLNSSDGTALALNKEILAYSNISFSNVLFGLGFIESKQFEMLGFSGESFIFRILAQVGVINFILIIAFSLIVFKNKNIKVSLMLLCLFFFMTIHYAILNIYFYIFIISFILMYEKSKSYNYYN